MTPELTNSDFDAVVGGPGVKVVRFWAAWCGPCIAMVPAFQDVAQELADDAGFGEVNVDNAPELAHRFGVQGIPAVLLYKDGTVVDRAVGMARKGQLISFIRKHLG